MRIGMWMAVVVAITGCGSSAAGGLQAGSEPAAVAEERGASSPDDPQLPDVLEVSCRDGEIQLGSLGVRARTDGVHVHVLALPDDGTTVELSNVTDDDTRPGLRGGAHSTGITVLDTVAPGQVLVRCYPDEGPQHFQSAHEDPDSVSIAVIDDSGRWREPPTLSCQDQNAHVIFDYGGGPSTDQDTARSGTLEKTAAADLGYPTDAIRTYGYAAGTWRWAAALDDGQPMKLGSYQQRGDSWLIQSMSSCSDLGSRAS